MKTWLIELCLFMENIEANNQGYSRWQLSNTTYISYNQNNLHGIAQSVRRDLIMSGKTDHRLSSVEYVYEVKRGIKRLIDDKRALVLLRRHLPKGEFEALQLKHELCQ